MSELSQEKQNEIFATTVIQAWVTSKIELDKMYVGLSAGGIGVIVTLLARDRSIHNVAELLLFVSATVFFCFAILAGIGIFTHNPKQLEAVYKGKDDRSPWLSFLDQSIRIFFLFGLFLALLAGFSSSWESFREQESMMADKMLNDSANKGAPKQMVTESLNDIATFRPEAHQSGGGSTTVQQPTSQAHGSSQGTTGTATPVTTPATPSSNSGN